MYAIAAGELDLERYLCPFLLKFEEKLLWL
jgi:hypothetical protein